MGSKGRIPPPHMRRPLPGPGVGHLPDAFSPGMHPPMGNFPPFDMMPPPEIMEQKLAAQHGEMQRLATENQRLAATHGSLRHVLAASQHELQILHAEIGAMESEREQTMRGLMDKIGKMEAELQTAESVKRELHHARAEAQNLVLAREECMAKVHQVSQDLQRARLDVQQIPALMSELEGLRQESQHCRATYEYEKKFYSDHLESLQTMEKNYMAMAREVEKLRAELMNVANVDRRAGGTYGTIGNNEGAAHHTGQNAYEDGYGAIQGHGPSSTVPGTVSGTNAGAQIPAYGGHQRGVGYDAPRGPAYNPQMVAAVGAYDPHRAAAGMHGQMVPNNVPYGSSTPPARPGSVYEAQPRGGNPVRR